MNFIFMLLLFGCLCFYCWYLDTENKELQNKNEELLSKNSVLQSQCVKRENNRLRDENKILKEEVDKQKRKFTYLKFLISLLHHPNPSEVILVNGEKYSTGNNFSRAIFTTMYGDGRIDVYDSLHKGAGNTEPKTEKEMRYYFGDDAEVLWIYHNIAQEVFKNRHHEQVTDT